MQDYFIFDGQITNSMQVVPVALLRYWWFAHDYQGAWMPRTDTGTLANGAAGAGAPLRRSVVAPEPYPVLVAFKELVRHFDGYSHVGIDINACPPLFIPDGFFSGTIRIQYGGDQRRPATVLVNPCKANYSTVDPDGADIKSTLEDLPLFWRSRIVSVDAEGSWDDRRALRARNEAVVIAATECAAVPARKLRVALRFHEGDDVDAHSASLDACAREWRLARYYDAMARLRTAAGVAHMQAVWRALSDADVPVGGDVDRALADAVRLAATASPR